MPIFQGKIEAPKRDIFAIIDFIRSAPVNLNLNDLSYIVYVLSWVTLQTNLGGYAISWMTEKSLAVFSVSETICYWLL